MRLKVRGRNFGVAHESLGHREKAAQRLINQQGPDSVKEHWGVSSTCFAVLLVCLVVLPCVGIA